MEAMQAGPLRLTLSIHTTNHTMTKTPLARFAPLHMIAPLATFSLRELNHRYEDPNFFNVPKHVAPAYRRAIKKEINARAKADAAKKMYEWRSTGRIVVVGPPVAAFRS